MTKSILIVATSLLLSASAFAAEAETVRIAGAGGRAFDSGNDVKNLKQACAIANTVAENQAKAGCEALGGNVKEIGSKSVIPVVNSGGRSGSCRVSLDLACEMEF